MLCGYFVPMSALQDQELAVGEGETKDAPGGLAGGIPRPRPRPAKEAAHRRDRISDGLSRRILARLPLAVIVVDAQADLLFWNEQAGVTFGCPPRMAAERPALAAMLARVGHFTPLQRERITAFAMAHLAAGDRVEPDGCLQLSLDRGWRVVIQVHGLGDGRWMLVFNDGKGNAAAMPTAPGAEDAWLDTLTGLGNRRHFNAMLQQAVDDATVDRRAGILLINLDRLAQVNQTLGLPVGDGLLCLVAQRLRREVRDGDVLVRLGGDAFALLLPNGDGAESLAARSVVILARPFLVDGHRVTISASVGLVRIPDHGTSADAVMRHAEMALQQAKSAGGRAWCQFDAGMLNQARERQELQDDLREALARKALSLVYQPCGQGSSHQVSGFESWPRWDHATSGLVPASVVTGLAEAAGLVVALGEWQLKTACADAVTWPAPTLSAPRSAPVVVVRIAAGQLQEPGRFEAAVGAALAESGLPAARLALKIPAALLASGEAALLAVLHRLRTLGVQVVTADSGASVGGASVGGANAGEPPLFPLDAGFHERRDRSGKLLILPSGIVASLVNYDPETE